MFSSTMARPKLRTMDAIKRLSGTGDRLKEVTLYGEPDQEKNRDASYQRENRVDVEQGESPVGHVGTGHREARMGNVYDLHHAPGEAETDADEREDASHENAADDRLYDDYLIQHGSISSRGRSARGRLALAAATGPIQASGTAVHAFSVRGAI